MRLRIHFAKTEAMRYTGHLDLHRAWERTFRRAMLPLAYSQGFRPHPRINLGCALPLGFTSQDEVVDIWLEQSNPIQEIESALQSAIPPGIQLQVEQTGILGRGDNGEVGHQIIVLIPNFTGRSAPSLYNLYIRYLKQFLIDRADPVRAAEVHHHIAHKVRQHLIEQTVQ